MYLEGEEGCKSAPITEIESVAEIHFPRLLTVPQTMRCFESKIFVLFFFSYFKITKSSYTLTPFSQTHTLMNISPSVIAKGQQVRSGDITEHRWPNHCVNLGRGFPHLPDVLLLWMSVLPTGPSVSKYGKPHIGANIFLGTIIGRGISLDAPSIPK